MKNGTQNQNVKMAIEKKKKPVIKRLIQQTLRKIETKKQEIKS